MSIQTYSRVNQPYIYVNNIYIWIYKSDELIDFAL